MPTQTHGLFHWNELMTWNVEQAYFLKAILENIDLSDHMADAVNSLRIVLAADRSIREKRVVEL